MQAGDILTEDQAAYIEALEKAYDTFMGASADLDREYNSLTPDVLDAVQAPFNLAWEARMPHRYHIKIRSN